MPVTQLPGLRLPNPDRRAFLDYMPQSDIPVIRQPFQQGDLLPFWALNPVIGDHHLYQIADDPAEQVNRIGEALESKMIELLRVALLEVEAPQEQFDRLGIA